METAGAIKKYLGRLGVEPEAATLYMELSRNGYSSALQLAKSTGISRTQVYRLLEGLQQIGLVNGEQLSYGTLYRALPLENVGPLLAEREAETAAIRGDLRAMTDALKALAGGTGPEAAVRHYSGMSGLQEVSWNLGRAQKEFRVFEGAQAKNQRDPAFARRCREQYAARSLYGRYLTNAEKIAMREVEPLDPAYVQYRHADPMALTISFDLYIYNDIVTLVDYEHATATEITHSPLRMMLQQLFDAQWALATPLQISKK
jgi:sugar-specific transcriptional regulator TrmB